jgi:hypothetical protein
MTNVEQARNSGRKALLFLTVLLAGSACSDFDIENKPPVPKAKVLINGAPPTPGMDIPYMGAPIAVTLDGSESIDPDGHITSFRWLRNATQAERYPEGNDPKAMPFPAVAGDPAPTVTSTVMLGEGEYSFSLWVTDDRKMVGGPSIVSFTIKTPSNYMPDATCSAGYMNDSMDCKDCVCSPNSTTGCLEQWQACFANSDAMFVTLCKAVVDCAVANSCSGAACYTAAFCMTQIDAAATYMGGALADCSMGSAMTNPCAAASQFGACTAAAEPSDTMPGACGMLCN